MTIHQYLAGVYAAAVTPLRPDGAIALQDFPLLLDFLAQRGCHGALLFGTTGEGPSFSPTERLEALRSALLVRQKHPQFRLLFGTGTPSLEETASLTRAAFDLGVDGVVVLPPYYFRKVSDDGLMAWFSQVIETAVPAGGALLGYHFPNMSGVPLSLDLLKRLKEAYPETFAGIKDSSSDPEHARLLDETFGADLLVLTGSDRLFSHALQHAAGGCITAMANICSPDLRLVWEAHLQGTSDETAQARLSAARSVIERYPPAPSLIKALLARQHALPRWNVRPPLLPLPAELEEQALGEFISAAQSAQA